MADEVAVAQMEGAWYEVEAMIEDTRQSIREIENSLCSMLGRTPAYIERGDFSDFIFPEKLSAGMPVSLLSRRPDVRMAEQNLVQAYYATNVARASLYPSVVLSGMAGWTNDMGSAIVNPGGLILSAAGSLLQPIFNARKNRGNVEIAALQQKEAEIAFRQTILDAGMEVNDALTRFQTASANEDWHRRQVDALNRAVIKSEELMAHSSSTYLDVLTAQQSWLQARIALVQDTYDKIEAVIILYKALGGGYI